MQIQNLPRATPVQATVVEPTPSTPPAPRFSHEHAALKSNEPAAPKDGIDAYAARQVKLAHSPRHALMQRSAHESFFPSITQVAPQELAARQRQAAMERVSRLIAQQQAPGARPVEQAPSVADMAAHCADGDSQLAVLTAKMMMELKQGDAIDSRLLENIPGHSTFGLWWKHLTNAFNSVALRQWAQQQNLDITTLRFDPANQTLTGKVNGAEQTFAVSEFAHTFAQLFDALTPLVTAANVLVPDRKPLLIGYPGSSSAAPFELVFTFYGGNLDDIGTQRAVDLADDMTRNRAFPVIAQSPQRSATALKDQHVKLGNSNDRHALADRLAAALDGKPIGQTYINVDPNSSHEPKGLQTTRQFILDNGWNVPQNQADLANLLLALRTPLAQSPPLGNLWGFLSTPLGLSAAQRRQITQLVNDYPGAGEGLFKLLSPSADSAAADAGQNLERLLMSEEAQALGLAVQTALKVIPSPTSIRQCILTALVLDVDAAAGETRNSIAGYDFMHTDNWGLTASELLAKFTRFLSDNTRVTPAAAPTAAHLLLAGMAPHLLVQQLPAELICGTPAWALFCTAVNRIEQVAPGAASGMTYQQVMDFQKIAPISKTEEVYAVRAQMNPVIDWGIINAVIPRHENDQYTPEQAQRCLAHLREQQRETNDAARFLAQTPPTRRAMALANLKARFGDDIDYEASILRKPNNSTAQDRWASIVELYEAGQLADNAWELDRPGVPFERIRQQAHELPDINAQFSEKIAVDYQSRRTHTIATVKNLLSWQRMEDRIPLDLGDLSYYSVRESDTSAWENFNAKTGRKGSHGLLIRSRYDGNVYDYAMFPDIPLLKRISGLPDPMPTGGTNAAFGKIYDGKDEGTHNLPLDFTAFSSVAMPRDNVRSDVIVDPVTPETRINGELVNDSDTVFVIGHKKPNMATGYFGERFQSIATTVVDSHFLRKEQYEAAQRGHNAFETADMTFGQRLNFLARMVPGVTSVEDVIEGNYVEAGKDLFIDAAGLFLGELGGKVWTLGAEAFEHGAVGAITSESQGAAGAAVDASRTLIANNAVEGAQTTAIKDLTAANTSKSVGAISRMQNGQLVQDAGEAFLSADSADGSIIRSGTGERINVSAQLEDGEWYAYDAKSQTTYGPALDGFVPESKQRNLKGIFDFYSPAQVDDELTEKFQAKVIQAKFGDEAAFQNGYRNIKPENIPGYDPTMGQFRIKQLIAESRFTPEQVGSLIRHRERLIVNSARIDAEIFSREMDAAGGTIRGMPQSFYLSVATHDIDGECAALSNAMALALLEGRENQLFDNLALVIADPDADEAKKFIETLKALQFHSKNEGKFHATGLNAPVYYQAIVSELSTATTSKTLMISSKDHAMFAGVRVDPADASKKSWYFYDPNYGLANFPTQAAMEKGLESSLKSGHAHYGNFFTGPQYKVSVFNQAEMAERKVDIERVRSLSLPL